MANNVFRKSLVIGIIMLFLGASIIPGISGNIINFSIVQDKDIVKKEINKILQVKSFGYL